MMRTPRNMLWVLDGHTPVPCTDIETWGRLMETIDRRLVARDAWQADSEAFELSTVFLTIPHNMTSDAPWFFETMLFTDGHGEELARYRTWDEAEKGHKAILQQIKRTEAMTPSIETETYAIIDIHSGYVWGVTDAVSPEDACREIDAELGAPGRGYATFGPNSGAEREGKGGYLVHRVPAGFTVENGQEAAAIRAVEAHRLVAVVLTSEPEV